MSRGDRSPLALPASLAVPAPLVPPAPLTPPASLEVPHRDLRTEVPAPGPVEPHPGPAPALEEVLAVAHPPVLATPPRLASVPTAKRAITSTSRPAADARRAGGSGPRWWLAGLSLLGVMALLVGGGDQHRDHGGSGAARASAAGSAAASHALPTDAVGMPIPGGSAPVRPVRIVLSLRHGSLPRAERRALAEWIGTTQHSATRVRLAYGQTLSPPLDAAALAHGPLRIARRAGTRRAAARWLQRGSAHRRAGAVLRIGDGPPVTIPSLALLRAVRVPALPSDRRIRRQLAARIARQIMVSARQRQRGTTKP
jgi:hypothetical protein